MKRIAAFLAVNLLLSGASHSCFADMGIIHLSREDAKELGIEIRLKGNAPNEVWVALELKADGKLKDFRHVSLEIREGGKLLVGYAPMQERRSRSGGVIVQFMANRDYLEKITLSVVAGTPGDLNGFELRVKDFVEAGKTRR